MKSIPADIQKWLNTPPKKNEVIEISMGADAPVKIIPQKIVESLLDEMTGCDWDTVNFKSTRYLDNGRMLMDAQIDLIVSYHETADLTKEKKVRRLVGAVTFDVTYFGNDHHNNTAKSLCISNAASELGPKFGRNLNPSVYPPIGKVGLDKQSKILNTINKVAS